MSTPAEILAQQQAQQLVDVTSASTADSSVLSTSDQVDESSMSDDSSIAADRSISSKKDASINFPTLGSTPAPSAGSQGSKSVWGTSIAQTNGHKQKVMQVKTASVQEIFTIDLDQAVTITKSELLKLLTDLKKKFNVSVETTLSQKSNKRTFLISGVDQNNKMARREIIKKLTKPVSVEFTIPSKLRGVVIGPGGKNLTPIVNATGVKIDIEKDSSRNVTPVDDEDDFFGNPVKVNIHGDSEGVAAAKTAILSIIDQNTKSVSVKVAIPEDIKAFVRPAFENSISVDDAVEIFVPSAEESTSKALITGPREQVLSIREQFKSLLDNLSQSIVSEKQSIKKSFHRFIDASEVFAQTSVVVKVPPTESASTEVELVGKADDIKKSLDHIKSTTDSYKVLALEVSKAHGGNLDHAKNLVAYFTQSGFFDDISTDSIIVSSAPIAGLFDQNSKVVQVDISCSGNVQRAEADAVKKAIIDKVNAMPPHSIKNVTDINSFVFNQLDANIEEVAKENKVYIIPVSSLTKSGDLLLLVAEPVESDFAQTPEEIATRLQAVDDALSALRQKSGEITSQVFTVASTEQDLVSGSLLRTIYSHYTPGGIVIALHSNAEGPSTNEILISGSKEEVPKVIEEFQKVIEDVKNYEEAVKYTDTMNISNDLISRLIGQKGAHINMLKEKYDVRIDFDDDNTDGKSTPVKLKGLKMNVDEAISEINTLVRRWADEKVSKLKVSQQYYRLIFIYIKRLETKYKVNIHVNQDDETVTIRGPSKGVSKTEEEIKDLIKYEEDHSHKITIKVPTHALGRILGKGGDVINRIAADSETEINSNKKASEESKAEYSELEIKGTKTGVKQAEKQINEIVSNSFASKISVPTNYHGLILGPMGSNKRELVAKSGGTEINTYIEVPSQGSGSEEITVLGPKKVVESIISEIKTMVANRERRVTETCEVPKSKHRSIIGTGGQIRKQIQSDFDVFLNIPDVKSESTIVQIEGLPENVEKAKAKIEELTKDKWLVEIMVPASVHSAIAERGALFKRFNQQNHVSIDHGSFLREATKLSKSEIATPPEQVFGDETESHKWTVIEDEGDSRSNEKMIPWRLQGDAQNVAKVEAIIKSLIDRSTKCNATGYFYSSKPEIFSKIVGPQGKRLQQLKDNSGCFIIVPRSGDNVSNVIYVRGEKDGLEKVKNSLLASLN